MYEFSAPNGKRYRVEANTPDEAQRGFAATVAASPMMFQKPGVAAALKDLQPKPRGISDLVTGERGPATIFDTPTGRALSSMSLGLAPLVDAGAHAGVTALQHAIPGGANPSYTPSDMFDAYRLHENAYQSDFAARHPVTAATADIAGALLMPGGRTVGKFVVGRAAPKLATAGKRIPGTLRLLQTVRGAGAGGALTGAQAAATAKPGEEVQQGERGALIGALLTPVVGAGIGAVTASAPAVSRAVARLAGKGPTPAITSAEKLAKVLRKEGVRPDALQAAVDEWSSAGGVTPNLIDILKTSGASPGVLRLLQKSGVQAPSRVVAEQYAQDIVEGVQPKARAEAAKLKTGEPRTPSRIKADLEAKYADADALAAGRAATIKRRADTKLTTIDKGLEKNLAGVDSGLTEQTAQVDQDLAAGRQEAPAAPVERESGAAKFADELNARYDASRKVYEDSYREAEAAKPESAVVAPKEIRPLFTSIYREIGNPNPDSSEVKSVLGYLDTIKKRTEPLEGFPNEEPQVSPLTVLQIQHMRQQMNDFASKFQGAEGGALAVKVKKVLDAQLQRLVDEDKIVGDDPAVVDKWKTAIKSYAQHMDEFGSGLAQKLTERTPGKPDERVVEPWRAADVIFGSGDKVKPLNAVLHDVEPALKIATPEAIDALKGELYGRVKPEDLPKLRQSTGGKLLLPEGLTEQAIAAQEANKAADAAATDAKRVAAETATGDKAALTAAAEQRRVLAENSAATRAAQAAQDAEAAKAPINAEQQALATGEGALSTPAEAFAPALAATDTAHLPVVASGAKQAILNAIERRAPESTSVISDLTSPQATQNLGAALGNPEIAALQARLRGMRSQARNAQELAGAAGASGPHESPMIESVGPYDIVNPQRGIVDAALHIGRRFGRLNPEEYAAALHLLTHEGDAGLNKLLPHLIQKYSGAKRALAPFVVRPAAGGESNPDALDQLRQQYGLD